MQDNYFYTSNLIKINSEQVDRSFDSYITEVVGPGSWSNYAHSPNIVFETSKALLRVSRSSTPHIGSSISEDYEVLSPYDKSVTYGTINLDQSWRHKQGDDLPFIVIQAVEREQKMSITQLMCIEYMGEKMF